MPLSTVLLEAAFVPLAFWLEEDEEDEPPETAPLEELEA